MLRKSGFMHMTNNFKVAGKYWKTGRSFSYLHEYEDLAQVYLTYIESNNSWNDGLGWVSWCTWNIIPITCFCLNQYFL